MSEFRDVIILLPGITGSALANKNGKEVWGTSGGAIWRAVTSLGNSIEGLTLPADGSSDGVTATRLIPDVTIVPGLIKIDGYSAIEEFLVDEFGLKRGQNYLPFPYDWRLDNRVNAKRLEQVAMDALQKWRVSSGNANARLVLIGHSMGGLISRYFLECLGGWQHTRNLITLGTPHRGSLNAVDFLVHGMKKGIGPLGVDLTPMLRSLPSVYQLLPNYPCVDVDGGALRGVADATKAGHMPHVDEMKARDALAFHNEIADQQASNAKQAAYLESGYRIRPVVGVEQPTSQSARSRNGKVELLRSMSGKDDGGDGTVPRVSATPLELFRKDTEIFAAETHGSLQNLKAALTNVKGILTQPDVDLPRLRRAGMGIDLTLDVDDVVLPGEPLTVRARSTEGNPQISVSLTNTQTNETIADQLQRGGEEQEASFELKPGIWRVTISAQDANPVTDLAVVAAP